MNYDSSKHSSKSNEKIIWQSSIPDSQKKTENISSVETLNYSKSFGLKTCKKMHPFFRKKKACAPVDPLKL